MGGAGDGWPRSQSRQSRSSEKARLSAGRSHLVTRPELAEPGLAELEPKHHLVKPDLTGSLEAVAL